MDPKFTGFITFGILSALLLVGFFLRNKVKLLQNYMVPASLIGGVIGFVLINSGVLKFGDWTISSNDFTFFLFHGFNISYISLMLTCSEKSSLTQTKDVVRGGMWQSLLWCLVLTLQCLLGWAVIWGYNLFTGSSLSELMGALVAHGFAQGPGQGYTMGLIWEEHAGVANAATIGMIYGAGGFLVATIVGVPWARWFIRKNLNANRRANIDQEFLSGVLKEDTIIHNGRETTHSSTIDTLTFHLALIGIVYLFTYIELHWLDTVVRPWLLTIPGMKGPAWMCSMPMFYMHAMINAVLLRIGMEKLGARKLMDHAVQNRITGAAVDILIVATLASIEFVVLSQYLTPILLVSVSATLMTFLIFLWFGRRKTPFGPESTLAQFGAATGSSASGMLLLRILDPDFSTSAAKELAFFNVAATGIGAIVTYVWAPGIFELSTFELFTYYGLYALVVFAAMFFLKLVDKKAW